MIRADDTRWLLGHTRDLLRPLVASVLCRIGGQLLGVALFVVAFRGVTGEFHPWWLALVLVLLSIAKAALRYAEHYTGHWVAFAALQRLREKFFASLVPQAPAATRGRAGAELTTRATRDIDRIEVFFAHTFPPAVSAVVVPVVALIWLAFVAGWLVALVLAGFVAATLGVPLLSERVTDKSAREVAALRGKVATEVGDNVQGVREVLAFDAGSRRLHSLAEVDAALVAARSKAAAIEGARAALTTGLQAVSLVAVLLVAMRTGPTTAQIASALAVAIGLWGPARGVDDFASGLDAVHAATARLREVMDGTPVVADLRAGTVLPAQDSSIAFDEVSFGYRQGQPAAVAQLTWRLEQGEWGCIVGASGSGKSTAAALLVRLWDPQVGAVLLGGVDVRDLSLADVRSRVALVQQTPTLLRGSVAENLRLAAPDASDEHLTAALEAVDLDGWVAMLPKGMQTPIGERGLTVSGGQLQRLAIARALVAEPRVLVLDEALSQLDGPTAATVRDRVRAFRDDLTVVEITHRADLIPDDAHVVVLDGGRMVETGPALARLALRG